MDIEIQVHFIRNKIHEHVCTHATRKANIDEFKKYSNANSEIQWNVRIDADNGDVNII